MPQNSPDAKAFEEHLEQVLSSRAFTGSDRLREFLRYTARKSLAGDRRSLKEAVIGVEVFGRDASYDPRIDPVVRVMAGRLRRKLDLYYETEGQHQQWRILFPKGRYEPEFQPREPQPIEGAARNDTPAIAVLPFAPLSSDAEQEYFSDGMTDAIIAELARVNGLRVISRTSVLRFKTAPPPIPEIARLLDVDHLLEGSVLRAGNRVRIIAQLIAYPPERHLWAGTYERDLSDVLQLQADIARTVTSEIHLRLASGERPAVDADSYLQYLRGRHEWQRDYSEPSLSRGVSILEAVVTHQPNFALAHAALAEAYGLLARYFYVPGMAAKSRNAAETALSLDATLVDAQVALASCWTDEFNWAQAQEQLETAIANHPSHATARVLYGNLLQRYGRVEEGAAELKRAYSLDPLSLYTSDAFGMGLFRARRYAEAEEQFRRILAMNPAFYPAYLHAAVVALQLRKFTEALSSIRQGLQLTAGMIDMRGLEGAILARAGQTADARAILAELYQRAAHHERVAAHTFAHLYRELGEPECAMDHLEHAFAHKSFLVGYLKADPLWDSLRDHPRFQQLVERLNL